MKNKKKIVLLLVLITSITIGYSQDDKLKRNEFGCHMVLPPAWDYRIGIG
jgi:hypothetical protein